MERLDARFLADWIKFLDPFRFANLGNDLLVEAAVAAGIDRSCIATNLHVHEPDGGIDARCVSAPRQAGRVIPKACVVYQFKSGRNEKSAAKIAEEDIVGKPRVAEAISQGHACVYIAAWDRGDAFESEIRAAVEEQGLSVSPGQIIFIGGDALARLLRAYPALVARFLGIDQWLLGFDDWSRLPTLTNPYQRDAAVDQQLADFRLQLDQSRAILRLVGAAGNGKTRFVLEAIRGGGFEGSTLYAGGPGELSPSFVSHLRSTPDARCLIVVDEVDDTEAERLTDRFSSMPEGVRVILIGTDASGRAQRGTLQVGGLSEDLLVATINAIVPGLPQDVPRSVAAVCERSPKLAVVIAEQIKADPTLVPARFAADGRVRSVLDRYLKLDPGNPSWKAVSGVALLERVGWTRDVEIESERLFEVLNLIPVDARRAVDDVHRRLGVVPTAGRYRYVSPAILADHLAARQMGSWTQGYVRQVQAALTPAMADSFARRLRRLASVLENRSVVEEVLLGEAGPFRSLSELESGDSRLLRHLAGAFPLATLRALQRVIGPASTESLRAANRSRRNLVEALEELLWLRDTFDGAAELLLRLALAENETWGNNSTGVWVETFQTVLGRTSAGLDSRVHVLRRSARSADPRARVLVARALEAALEVDHLTRMGMPPRDVEGMPAEAWQPGTYGEWFDAVEAYLEILSHLLLDAEGEVALAATKALGTGAKVAVRFPAVTQSWEALVRMISGMDYTYRSILLEAIETQIERHSRKAGEGEGPHKEVTAALRSLHAELLGTDFSSRFRWTLTRNPWRIPRYGESDASGDEERVRELATEVASSPALLLEQWAWLLTQQSPIPERFLEHLGRLDRDRECETQIVAVARYDERAWGWLGFYDLSSEAAAQDATFADRRVRELQALGIPPSYLLRFLLQVGHSPARLSLLQRLFESGAIPAEEIADVAYSAWLGALRRDEARQLLAAAASDPAVANGPIQFAERYLSHHPDARPFLREISLDLLGRPLPGRGGTAARYTWAELAKLYVEAAPADVTARALQRLDEGEWGAEEIVKLISRAWEVGDRIRLFEEVFTPWMESHASRPWRMPDGVKQVPFSELGVEYLRRWVAIRPETRARLLASLIGPPIAAPTDVHAMLLETLADPDVIGSVFFCDYIAGAFSGSPARRTRTLLAQAREWLTDPRAVIRHWTRKVVHDLEVMLRRDETWEAEERFL